MSRLYASPPLYAIPREATASALGAITQPSFFADATGHSPDALMRTYAHAFDKRKREAVDALGAARMAAREAE